MLNSISPPRGPQSGPTTHPTTSSLRALAAVALLFAGCFSGIEPLVQSTPSALRGTPSFVVLPIDYRELWVREQPAGDYLLTRSDDQRQSFQGDTAIADMEFRTRLGERLGPAIVAAAAPGVFTVRTAFERWEPGSWFFTNAEARLVLSVFDDRGREIERVRLTAGEIVNVIYPSETDRIRSCAKKLADRAARYLEERTR